MEWLKELIKKFGGKEELEIEIAKELEKSYVPTSKIQEEKEKKEREKSERQIKEIGETIKEALKQAEGQGKKREETSPPKMEETLQKSLEELQKKYDELQAHNEQLQNNRKESLLDAEIAKAGGRNPKTIKALLDMEKIAVKEDGTLEGLDLEGLKKSDSYLFNMETQGVEGTGFIKGDTVTVDIDKMNYTQLCEYLENNPNAKIK